MKRRPFSLRNGKPSAVLVDQHGRHGPMWSNGAPVPPTMDPFDAALFDLERIVKKAAANLEAQGVRDVGPAQPRTWRGACASHKVWMVP